MYLQNIQNRRFGLDEFERKEKSCQIHTDPYRFSYLGFLKFSTNTSNDV